MSVAATEDTNENARAIEAFLATSRLVLNAGVGGCESDADSRIPDSRGRRDPLFGTPVVYSRSLQVMAAQTRDEVMRLMTTKMARPDAWSGVVELFA